VRARGIAVFRLEWGDNNERSKSGWREIERERASSVLELLRRVKVAVDNKWH